MSELKKRLAECNRHDVLNDTVSLIDSEVASKSGLTGTAVKAGYKIVKKLRNGKMIYHASDVLLDQFTEALSPYYEAFLQSKDDTFEHYVSTRHPEVAQSLLKVTDKLAERKTSNIALKKSYTTLRKQAEKHVEHAVPGLSRIIDHYAPK